MVSECFRFCLLVTVAFAFDLITCQIFEDESFVNADKRYGHKLNAIGQDEIDHEYEKGPLHDVGFWPEREEMFGAEDTPHDDHEAMFKELKPDGIPDKDDVLEAMRHSNVDISPPPEEDFVSDTSKIEPGEYGEIISQLKSLETPDSESLWDEMTIHNVTKKIFRQKKLNAKTFSNVPVIEVWSERNESRDNGFSTLEESTPNPPVGLSPNSQAIRPFFVVVVAYYALRYVIRDF